MLGDLEAKILICDPKLQLSDTIRSSMSSIHGEAINVTSDEVCAIAKLFGGQIDYTNFKMAYAEKIELANRIMDETCPPGAPPYYSLIAYHSDVIDDNALEQIRRISRRDQFLPQLLYGKKLKQNIVTKCAKAGIQHFASSQRGLDIELNKIFQRPYPIVNGVMIKLGGSSDDFDILNPRAKNLYETCQIIKNIHFNKLFEPLENPSRIVLNVGAGQLGIIPKTRLKKYEDIPWVVSSHPKRIADALKHNAEFIKDLFSSYRKENLINLLHEDMNYIHKDFDFSQIPLAIIAPHFIMAKDKIPLQDSDTHTIAVAEYHRLRRVILLKRTDGIYFTDPYRGFTMDKHTGKCANYDLWKRVQEINIRHEEMDIHDEDLYVYRDGTGEDGLSDGTKEHLIEDSALEYFRNCQFVEEILVVHLAPEEMYKQIGENMYQHVVVKDDVVKLRPRGWLGYLENSIVDAISGVAKSRIINSKAIAKRQNIEDMEITMTRPRW